jgi:integrase
MKPTKPTPDFPLFAHANGQWAKKLKGKLRYYGRWADAYGALSRYLAEFKPSNLPPELVPDKPPKPHPDFPLYAHASGKWAKKIRGRVHYFGTWDDPQGSLEEYLEVKDVLLAGKTLINGDRLTVRDLVNRFLTTKKTLVATGEITQRTWDDYHKTCERIIRGLGKHTTVGHLRPEDFGKLRRTMGKGLSPTTLYNRIGRVRVVFKYAFDEALIDRPVQYGQSFRKPSQSVMRKHRVERGAKMFPPNELRRIIEAAGVQLRAMIYLGVNCGFGNTDCMLLPTRVVDLDAGWLDFPRPKTGIERRAPLWPETVKAIRDALTNRPQPKDKAARGRVFVTKYGNAWEPKSSTDSPISNEMGKLLRKLGLHRPGLGFYALRHTFQTVGQKTLDKDAVRYIMGHVDDARDMGAVYNEERPSDERLREVTDHVRDWLRNTWSQKDHGNG